MHLCIMTYFDAKSNYKSIALFIQLDHKPLTGSPNSKGMFWLFDAFRRIDGHFIDAGRNLCIIKMQ